MFIPSEAQLKRARRRKSPVNLLLLLHWPIMWAFWWAQLWLFWDLLKGSVPEDGPLRHLGGGPLPLLYVLPPLISAIGPSMLTINFILHQIPPIARVFDREAEGHPRCSYPEAQRDLTRWSAIVLLVCTPISLMGLFLLH